MGNSDTCCSSRPHLQKTKSPIHSSSSQLSRENPDLKKQAKTFHTEHDDENSPSSSKGSKVLVTIPE